MPVYFKLQGQGFPYLILRITHNLNFEQEIYVDVIFSTTEMGEFIAIENWEEVRELMNKVSEDMIKAISEEKSKEERELFNTVYKPLFELYQTQQGIELLVYSELQYFLWPFGVMFEVEETLEYDDYLPNMLGGDPIRGKTKMYFESVNFSDEQCVFKQEMKLNPKDTKGILIELFKKMELDDKAISKALKTVITPIQLIL